MVVLYAGRFDPVTNGHLDVVRRAARIFERTIVGVFDAPEHQTLLSTESRVRLLEQCLTGVPGVSVERFDGLLVDFVRDRGATAIVRGVRSAGDLSLELEQALVYRDMAPDIEQVYLMSDVTQAFVRASRVRELAARATTLPTSCQNRWRPSCVRSGQSGPKWGHCHVRC